MAFHLKVPNGRRLRRHLKLDKSCKKTKTSPQNVIKCLYKKRSLYTPNFKCIYLNCLHTHSIYTKLYTKNTATTHTVTTTIQPQKKHYHLSLSLNSFPFSSFLREENTAKKKKSDKYKVPIIHFLHKRDPKK